jgi:hypothetical protein
MQSQWGKSSEAPPPLSSGRNPGRNARVKKNIWGREKPRSQRWESTSLPGLKETFEIPPPPQAEVRRYNLPGFKKNIWNPPSPTGRGEKVQSARVEKEHLKDPPPLHRIGGEKIQRRPGQKEHFEAGGKVEKVHIWPGLKETFCVPSMIQSVEDKRFARKRLMQKDSYKKTGWNRFARVSSHITMM